MIILTGKVVVSKGKLVLTRVSKTSISGPPIRTPISVPIPKYSLFEGDNYHFTGSAYDSDAATCHDQEAMDKFTQTKDAAMANVKDIPEQIEWTMVPIK